VELTAFLYGALQLASEAEAFATPPSSLGNSNSKSSLNLVPDQANQLVAAYEAICVENKRLAKAAPIQVDKTVASDAADATEEGTLSASRGAIAECKSFLTRVFHMPSIGHPGGKQEDVVYYPMVGFRFFEGIDSVFPTTCHVSCLMPTKSQKEEEVYGWFSPSCELDFFSEDICHNPIGSESDSVQ